jgi:hypothetical protein
LSSTAYLFKTSDARSLFILSLSLSLTHTHAHYQEISPKQSFLQNKPTRIFNIRNFNDSLQL